MQLVTDHAQMHPMESLDEGTVSLGVRLVGRPPHLFQGWFDLALTLQRRHEFFPGIPLSDGSLLFRCHARVSRDPITGQPRFQGPYCYGNPDSSFVYFSWDGYKGGQRLMYRRLQVQLSDIEWDQIKEVQRSPGAWLMASVRSTAPDGGPAYATAALIGPGWVRRVDN